MDREEHYQKCEEIHKKLVTLSYQIIFISVAMIAAGLLIGLYTLDMWFGFFTSLIGLAALIFNCVQMYQDYKMIKAVRAIHELEIKELDNE